MIKAARIRSVKHGLDVNRQRMAKTILRMLTTMTALRVSQNKPLLFPSYKRNRKINIERLREALEFSVFVLHLSYLA
jgi:hypothetical protein